MGGRRESIVLENCGQKLFGVIHLPSSTAMQGTTFPGIVISHGFGGTKIGQYRVYVLLAEALADVGIATLRIDARGCGDSEGEFKEMTVKGLVSDTLVALDYLREHSEIHREKTGLLGVSLGGAISVLAAKEDAKIKSLGLWAPVANGQLWQNDWETHYPQQTVDGHIHCGGMTAGSDFRDQFLALRVDHALEELSHLPLIHIQGQKDEVVFEGHRQAYKKARANQEEKSLFIELPNSNHNFTDPREREALLRETVTWFSKTLKGA